VYQAKPQWTSPGSIAKMWRVLAMGAVAEELKDDKDDEETQGEEEDQAHQLKEALHLAASNW
jgi:hypothetical protein